VQQAKDILSARKLIEVAIVEDVIKNATPKDYKLLREIVTSEQDKIEHKEISKGIRLSGDFHLLPAKISGNVTLERIATTLVPQTSLVIVLYERPDQPKCSHFKHFELIDVMQNGDVAKASSLMAKHIQGIEDRPKLDEREVVSDLEDIFRKR
jgi:DNA-binding GntR family transcriptional regulator